MGRIAGRPRTVVALGTGFALVVLSWALIAGTARGVSAPTPWDGVNPFRCTIQDAGQGTAVPDPGADPYCVRFDKTNQNVTQLGLVEFLTKEPARINSAAPKCFYYQEDHWRGSVIQSDQQTVVYEFYGHYFYNKATGDGGVWVTHFTIAGHTFDPRTLPGFPPQYDGYFGPGTGGLISHNDVPFDPSCAAKAQRSPAVIYSPPRCLTGSGPVTRGRLGSIRLGMTTDSVRARLGPPQSVKRNYLRYCVTSGGVLSVGHRDGAWGPSARTVIVITTSPRFTLRGRAGVPVRVGSSKQAVRRAFPGARVVFRSGRTSAMRLPSRGAGAGMIVLGITHGRVAYLATYSAGAIRSNRTLHTYLTRGL